jgi:pyruvate dehydrogenase E2 component (dihydrolipoamide acetyltransferase)
MEIYEFRMPSLGADMDEGRLVKWHIKPGDTVRKGDIILHIETEKAGFDAESFHGGKVLDLYGEPGQIVKVGTILARIETEEEIHERERLKAPSPASEVSTEALESPGVEKRTTARVRAAPATRKLAHELGVDISMLSGSGTSGEITPEDVRSASRKSPEERRRESMGRITARLMAASKREIPHYYLESTINFTSAVRWLEKHNADCQPDKRILPAAILLKAVADAAASVSLMNGIWEAGRFNPAPSVDLGVAVSLRGGGLIAPTIPSAELLSVHETMESLTILIQRARTNSLRGNDLLPPSITVTNLGDEGADKVFGVIYPPQVALVGFGRIVPQAVIVDGQIKPGWVVLATLSADHRVSDGHAGSRMLNTIRSAVESCEWK